MKKLKYSALYEYINILIASLAMALPLIVIISILLNIKFIYLALIIWIGVPIADYIYRKLGGKGLNENKFSE